MAARKQNSVGLVVTSRRAAIVIALWILLIHIAGVLQFSSGFLLTRPVLPNVSDVQPHTKASFDRAVVLVVDALRYDFVKSPENAEQLPYWNHFRLHELAPSAKNAFSVRFMADPPTTTLQRLKGLTTGSLPAMIDAGSNFAGFKIEEDNWVSQAAARLGPVAFVGDDTWESLFAHEFNVSLPFPSLNVHDLETVDNGVKHHLPDLIKNSTNKIVIGHMLGVDHVGHRYGPNHPAMSQKLEETFEFVKEIMDIIDDRTVLMVMGDHGMDKTGDHGGDSQLELEAALWLYSKRPIFTDKGSETVEQIDLVPTISGLLGLPIPFNSLGFPIQQAFNPKQWDQITHETAQQIHRYAQELKKSQVNSELPSQTPMDYQKLMLEQFRNSWIEFDMVAMTKGLQIFFGSAVAISILYNSVSSKNIVKLSSYITLGGCIGGMLGIISGSADTLMHGSSYWQFANNMLFWLAVGSLFGTLPALISVKPSRPNAWTIGALAFLALECCTSFSNSFVILEPRVLQFLLATVITLLMVTCAASASPIVVYLGSWYGGVLLVLIRSCSAFIVCREENGPMCFDTFYEPGSKLAPLWTLFAVGVLGLVFPWFLRRFWKIGGNDVGAASLMISMTSLTLVLSIAYWSLDNAEMRGWFEHSMFGLQSGKVLLGRLALASGFVGGLMIWWRSNVPIEIVLSSKGVPKKIEGYNNIHGAYALLTVVCMFWSLAIVNKPPGILTLAGLIYSCLAMLDLVDVSSTKYTILVPVVYDLLSHSFFYYTGHQATIPSIDWNFAFVASKGNSFPWSQITIVLNLVGPFLICSIVSVYSAMWRRPPFKDATQLVSFASRAGLGMAFVTTIRTSASVFATCVLRRHLMTWKIFAPRFIAAVVALITADIGCVLGLIASGHTIKKVTEMFG